MTAFRIVAQYLGGYPTHPKPFKGMLRLGGDGVQASPTLGKTAISIPWTEVTDVEVSDGDKHVTAGRVLTLGVLALAAKKKSSFLIVTTDAGEAIFELQKVGAVQVRAYLNRAQLMLSTAAKEEAKAEASEAKAAKEEAKAESKAAKIEAKAAKFQAKLQATMATPAGWYPDPEHEGQRRYWDGSSWGITEAEYEVSASRRA